MTSQSVSRFAGLSVAEIMARAFSDFPTGKEEPLNTEGTWFMQTPQCWDLPATRIRFAPEVADPFSTFSEFPEFLGDFDGAMGFTSARVRRTPRRFWVILNSVCVSFPHGHIVRISDDQDETIWRSD